MDPECLAFQELPVLHSAPLDQAALVAPGLQVYRGLRWDHCVRNHLVFLAAKMKRQKKKKMREQSLLLIFIRLTV